MDYTAEALSKKPLESSNRAELHLDYDDLNAAGTAGELVPIVTVNSGVLNGHFYSITVTGLTIDSLDEAVNHSDYVEISDKVREAPLVNKGFRLTLAIGDDEHDNRATYHDIQANTRDDAHFVHIKRTF